MENISSIPMVSFRGTICSKPSPSESLKPTSSRLILIHHSCKAFTLCRLGIYPVPTIFTLTSLPLIIHLLYSLCQRQAIISHPTHKMRDICMPPFIANYHNYNNSPSITSILNLCNVFGSQDIKLKVLGLNFHGKFCQLTRLQGVLFAK